MKLPLFLLVGATFLAAWVPATFGQAPAGGSTVDRLQGILIIGSPADLQTNALVHVHGVRFQGPKFLSEPDRKYRKKVETLRQELETRFINRQITNFVWGEEILTNVVNLCRAVDHPVIDAYFPYDQDTSEGRIQIVVFEGKVAGPPTIERHRMDKLGRESVDTQPNERLERRTRAQFGAGAGDALTTSQIVRDVSRLNRNPEFQTAGISLRQGEFAGETDVTLRLTNSPPWSVFAGYDDAGNSVIGLDRLMAGGRYYGLLGRGDVLSYQFTTVVDFESYLAHAVSYSLPTFNDHTLTAYGALASVDADLDFMRSTNSVLHTTGDNLLAGVRYAIPLTHGRRYRDELYGGFEFKDIETSLTDSASGLQFFNNPYKVGVFLVGYRAYLPDPRGLLSPNPGKTVFHVEGDFAPGSLVGGDSDADYERVRTGAESTFFVGRVGFDRETPLGWLLFWNVGGEFQWSSTRLLPSEAFSIGGVDTVRGFEQGVLLGDGGFVVRNELGINLPWLRRTLAFARAGEVADRFRVYGFFDYGRNFVVDSQGEAELGIGGAGGGVRLRLSRYLDLDLSYAFQVTGEDVEVQAGSAAEDVDARAHISVQARF